MSGYADQPKKRAAQRAELALEKAGVRHGFRACARKLAGVPYVVIHEAQGDVRRAYKIADIDLVAIRAKEWNYAAWRATVAPEESVDVAVYHFFFLKHDRRDLAHGHGGPILSELQRTVLALLLDKKDCGADLLPEQSAVLEIAKRLGLSSDEP
jgi:hypothetical protein